MTTEVQEVKIDSKTGLPELPEGYFWRVGTLPASKDRYGYSSNRYDRDGVFLMLTEKIRSEKHVPIEGKHWWNQWLIVETRIEEVWKEEHRSLRFRAFDNWTAESEEKIPTYGTLTSTSADGRGRTYVTYKLNICPETIALIAEGIWKGYLEDLAESQREAELKREHEANKALLFGDYPPKSLVDL